MRIRIFEITFVAIHMNTTAIVTKIEVEANLSEQRISWDARDKTVQREI